jgi:hypothetical protein
MMSWLFGKKNQNKVSDKVWITEKYKIDGILNDIKNSPPTQINILTCYFKDSIQQYTELFQQNTIDFEDVTKTNYSNYYSKNYILNADLIIDSTKFEKLIAVFNTKDIKLLFTEHYPIFSREKIILDKINSMITKPTETVFYSSLDEPIYQVFGVERINSVLEKLGLAEGEFIQHSMITSAIANAQEKIEQKVKFESKSNSLKDWFRMNNVF